MPYCFRPGEIRAVLVTLILPAVIFSANGPALGQDSGAASPAEERQDPKTDGNPFFRTAIPENVPASFSCYQGGNEILTLDRISSFLPNKVDGVLTYSLITRDGRNHLLYLGSGTTCRLTVTPPEN